MNIGQRIREAREDLGMQATVLARRVGVAPNTIYRIEAGDRTPSVALLEKIAHELRTEPADLFKEPAPLGEAPKEAGPEEWLSLAEVVKRMGAAGKAAQEVVRDWREETARIRKDGIPLPKYRTQEMYSFHNELCRLYTNDISSILESARREDIDFGLLVSGKQVRIAADPSLWPQDLRAYVYEAGARIAVLPEIIREIEQEAGREPQNTAANVAEEFNVEDRLPTEMLKEQEWREARGRALAEAGV
jgi:transcriptional regulator with XRE-family HTH domain